MGSPAPAGPPRMCTQGRHARAAYELLGIQQRVRGVPAAARACACGLGHGRGACRQAKCAAQARVVRSRERGCTQEALAGTCKGRMRKFAAATQASMLVVRHKVKGPGGRCLAAWRQGAGRHPVAGPPMVAGSRAQRAAGLPVHAVPCEADAWRVGRSAPAVLQPTRMRS